jgi:hypothetical protein
MIVSKLSATTRNSERTHSLKRIVMLSGLCCLSAALLMPASISTVSAQNNGSKKSKSDKDAPPVAATRRVLIFEPDAKGGVSEQIGDDIISVEEARLTATHLYEPIHFLSSLATVKLALRDQTLNPSDVRHPYDNDAKLKKLSGVTGYDLVMSASIDDYEYDAVKNQVNLVLSIRLIDYSGAKSVVRSAGASASSPANPTGNQSEYKMAAAVAKTLTDKLMNDILNPKPVTKPADTGTAK